MLMICNFIFLSTPSVRRATHTSLNRHLALTISIHALRAEGDGHQHEFCQLQKISIHALRAEGDQNHRPAAVLLSISIHALRAEGDVKPHNVSPRKLISIHALRAEGDSANWLSLRAQSIFLSTPSVRRATWRCKVCKWYSEISIHALRAEGDLFLPIIQPFAE